MLAGEHLAATRANDLILYDRGYPAFWLFALHHQEQRRFCARMLLAFSREISANSEAVRSYQDQAPTHASTVRRMDWRPIPSRYA